MWCGVIYLTALMRSSYPVHFPVIAIVFVPGLLVDNLRSQTLSSCRICCHHGVSCVHFLPKLDEMVQAISGDVERRYFANNW